MKRTETDHESGRVVCGDCGNYLYDSDYHLLSMRDGDGCRVKVCIEEPFLKYARERAAGVAVLLLLLVALPLHAGIFNRRKKNTEQPQPATMQQQAAAQATATAAAQMPPQNALDIMSMDPQDGATMVRWAGRDIVCPTNPPYGLALDIDTSVPVLARCMGWASLSVQWRAHSGLRAHPPVIGAPDGEYVTMPPGSSEYVVNAYPEYVHGAGPVPTWDEKWISPNPKSISPCAAVVTLSKGMAGRFDTIEANPEKFPLDVWIPALANDDTYDKTVPLDDANGRWPYWPCEYGKIENAFIRVHRPGGELVDVVLKRGE